MGRNQREAETRRQTHGDAAARVWDPTSISRSTSMRGRVPRSRPFILREIEPLHLLFAEEVCPPENFRAMARATGDSTTPIATGERLIAAYGCAN